ncbi:hypothetical protein HOP50_19g83710 [Chloropicon primus]|uniref:RING-type domain-containing protein n=2 Tax=Chloropicon primus TaxID=1764295 RepID=A0A5B8MZB5_9CHLO|nr:hypothetical protein A3770_19p83470 [Chloropicon primus]UPR05024.1 hypothetical protein HOP50_19g83710 [Chloropicon primus]|eukprot:QDZ25829.1 hypothetical protein A3770_19p83470 [Chloropicon primus]
MLGRGEGGRQNQRRSSGGQEDPLELAVHRASSTSVSSDSPRATPTAGAGNSTFDYNVVLLWLEQALPFLLILFCFFLREHLMEIGFFGLHTFLFLKGNQIIRSTIAHRGANSNSSKKLVLVTSLLSASSVLLLLVVFPQQKLWKSMVLIPPPHRLNVWHSLFRCALCDVTLRQAGVVVKASQLLVWRPAAGSQFRRQGHLLTFVEHATILYGLLLPVPIWYSFFQTETFGQIFSSVSTGFYLTMKISTLFEKVLNFVVALRILIQPVCDHYGTRATKEEVCELGDACCSICQDEMASPLKLRCNHIFCAECIGEWLDRDTTCPLCRTVVKSDVVRSFSDGSSGWILQLF